MLEKVLEFASAAHAHQKRRYSKDPYIVHPIRVMERCREFTDDIAVLSAALLHDVLEDTSISSNDIFAFLNLHAEGAIATRTLKYVEELTDIFTKHRHPRSNRRTRKLQEADRLSLVSREAQTIKYADIMDNCDVTHNEPNFASVYLKEALHLLQRMKNGDSRLRKLAIEKVEKCLTSLPASDGRQTV
jgi:(p)ppGpp synthase/HD superfamily hydrolase